MGRLNYVNCINYSSLLYMHSISGRNEVGNVLLYEATVLNFNFGFWSQLGRSGKNTIIFSRERLVKSCRRRNIKI